MKQRQTKSLTLLILCGLFTLTSCGQQALPAAPALASVDQQPLPTALAQGDRLQQAAHTLARYGITLNPAQVTQVKQGSVTFYTVPTNKPDIAVTLLAEGERVLTISAVQTAATITVTDLDTSAVTVARIQADGTAVSEQFGYARLDTSLTAIVAQSPVTEAAQAAVRAQAAALAQCTGSVPASLLQARAQAQNDYSSYNTQLGIAIAAQAGASAAVLVACGATVVTVGVSTPTCIGAAGLLATAVTNVEEKTRQREDAAIKIEYAQLAITQWKSDYAKNNNCIWY